MSRKKTQLIVSLILLSPLVSAIPSFAHGDKVVPHMADGEGLIRTKFDITNLSSVERITKVKLLFFRQNGNAWSIATNQGTASEFTLNLGRLQTIRIETLGTTSSLTTGYAVIRNTELTTRYSEDFEVSTTVYYEILSGSNVVDTISVPLGEPTLNWLFPVEIDTSKDLFTGFAIVNQADTSNNIELKLWKAKEPSSSDATEEAQTTFTLNAKEQRASFLNQSGLFPGKSPFKGILIGVSSKPVSILALLQTPTAGGLQYATLVPAYRDAQRKNTYTYLRQGFPLDADIPLSDYFRNVDEKISWDLLYETVSASARRLVPQPGSSLSLVGIRTDTQFDDINLEQLQGLTYSTNDINLNDASPNLAKGLTFAIKTALARYVKVKVAEVIIREVTNTDGTKSILKDLGLEVLVYR